MKRIHQDQLTKSLTLKRSADGQPADQRGGHHRVLWEPLRKHPGESDPVQPNIARARNKPTISNVKEEVQNPLLCGKSPDYGATVLKIRHWETGAGITTGASEILKGAQ
jgi:hypothetical protein